MICSEIQVICSIFDFQERNFRWDAYHLRNSCRSEFSNLKLFYIAETSYISRDSDWTIIYEKAFRTRYSASIIWVVTMAILLLNCFLEKVLNNGVSSFRSNSRTFDSCPKLCGTHLTRKIMKRRNIGNTLIFYWTGELQSITSFY